MLRETWIFVDAHSLRGPDGGSVPGANRLLVATALTHVAYVLPWSVLRSLVGFELIVPVVYLKQALGGPGGEAVGLGDCVVSPLLIQLPTVAAGPVRLLHKLDFDFIVPTGSYSPSAPVSTGNHTWSVNPFYAFTLLLGERWEASFRLHYLWNSANADAPLEFAPAKSIQAGQAFHANGAVSFAVIPSLRVGVAGYVLRQLTEARIDGAAVPASQEQVAALGPGLLFQSGTTTIMANAYWEFAAQNRPEGFEAVVTVLHIW